jgi:hypothetical protein
MRTPSKLVLTALMAMLCLAAMASVAGARRLAFSENHIRAGWPAGERVRFNNAEFNIECQMTMEGSFHSRTLSKVCGQLIGYITVASLPVECVDANNREGQAGALNGVEFMTNTLPWHVRFDSFTGVLPRIAGIRVQIIGAAFLLHDNTPRFCLYLSDAASPLYAIFELTAGTITAMRLDETRPIPKHGELLGTFCLAPNITLSRKATSVEIQRSTTKITVTLVA